MRKIYRYQNQITTEYMRVIAYKIETCLFFINYSIIFSYYKYYFIYHVVLVMVFDLDEALCRQPPECENNGKAIMQDLAVFTGGQVSSFGYISIYNIIHKSMHITFSLLGCN